MNWFRRVSDLDSGYSVGEIKLFKEIQRRKLNVGLKTHERIKLDYEKYGVHGCEPDYMWTLYIAFLDGEEVHSSEHRWNIDVLVKLALEDMGFMVDRFRYKPSMSDKRCREICDAIEERLIKL